MKGILAKITSKGLSRNVQKSRFPDRERNTTKRSALTHSLQSAWRQFVARPNSSYEARYVGFVRHFVLALRIFSRALTAITVRFSFRAIEGLSIPATPKVERRPRASMVGRLVAGLASFSLRAFSPDCRSTLEFSLYCLTQKVRETPAGAFRRSLEVR